MSAFETRLVPAWPADFAAFAAGAAGRSFAHGERFRAAFGAHGPPWGARLLVARGGATADAPIAAAWLGYVERRWGGAWVRSLPFGAPAGPLFAPALDAAARLEAARSLWPALEALARAEGWLGGDVTLSGPACDEEALRPASSLGCVRTQSAHVIDLSRGPEVWRASLKRSARHLFPRAERAGVVSAPSADAADLDKVYALHVAQAEEWGATRGVRPLEFYRALLEPPTPWRLWVSRVGGEIVCGVLCSVEPEETYAWWSGASKASRRVLAFPHVLMRIAYECGSATLNLGFSGGQGRLTTFKEQFEAQPRALPVIELAARPKTPYHALLALAREAARGRRKAA